jgi:hypothetical protein
MAGSINLSLSQQFDKLNGNLLSGGRLYFYAAGTDNPQNAFKDTGLTLVHSNPIILASDGRIPQLYFADGDIHVRLTDSGGTVQFDEDFVLVVGPSSGGGGGGSTVDPNAIFQTGMMDWQPVDEERAGWVRCNGSTIGNGSSGAHYHTDQHLPLYQYLWGKYNNVLCPVSGGPTRGPDANTDWAGGRTIGTLDFREVIVGGLSGMGSTDRGGYSAAPIERGDRLTYASIVGEIAHQLTAAEVPSHNHTGTGTTDANNVDHEHPVPGPQGTSGSATGQSVSGGSFWYGGIGSSNITSLGETRIHTHTFTTADFGSSVPIHNTTPRTMLGTFYMRM